jgi:hypothetical protein
VPVGPSSDSPLRTGRATFTASGSPGAGVPCRRHRRFVTPFRFRLRRPDFTRLRLPFYSGDANPLVPFALWPAFPTAPVGRHAHDYYGTSVALGLAPGRPSRVPSAIDVRARRRRLVRPLAWGHSPPPTLRRVRASAVLTPYQRGPASGAVAGDVSLHRWRLRFRQCGFRPIARVSRVPVLSAFRPLPLPHHALVPLGFRRKVGWVAQKSRSSELLPSPRGISNRVTRRTRPGQGW